MKLKYTLGFFLTIALVVLYYRYNPGVYDFFPECPFHRFLSLDCPGCGSQRAVYALLHGHVLQAFNYNALLVLSIPFLLIHLIVRVYAHFRKTNLIWNIWYKPVMPKILLIVVVLFWIIRNIPFAPFTYLAA
jgi:hypothetical protein